MSVSRTHISRGGWSVESQPNKAGYTLWLGHVGVEIPFERVETIAGDGSMGSMHVLKVSGEIVARVDGELVPDAIADEFVRIENEVVE